MNDNVRVPQDRLEAIAQDDFCEFPECSTHEPEIGVCVACDAIYAARECLKLRAENQRLMDLVRHQRGELHEAGLLSDKEYFALLTDNENGQRVARLESYDRIRAVSQRKDEAIAEAYRLIKEFEDKRAGRVVTFPDFHAVTLWLDANHPESLHKRSEL